MTSITVQDNPDPELRDKILKPLRAFNAGKVGPYQPNVHAVLLRDDADDVIGGAWTVFSLEWVFLDLIFVPDALRRQGFGTRLMQLLEERARARGFTGIWCDTFTFHARGFYEKLGFSVFGQLENYPGKETRFFMMKRL